MDKSKKLLIGFSVLIFTVLFTFFSPQNVFAQEGPCSKPKVAVIMKIYEANEGEFVKHLNEQYPSQPRDSWFYEIQNKVLEELRMNSPGTQFIQATGGIPKDCDYSFKYSLAFEYNRDLKQNVYYMSSFLWENGSCGLSTNILGKVIPTRNIDIFHTIERNIAAHGNIGNRIKKYEESHRVPPRGPEMKVTQDREYVSPLEEERKLKIKIDVKNCKGEPVYDKYHGQVVLLPKKTERGELECTDHFPQGCFETENVLKLMIQKPIGASATYTLKKGLNAEEDPIKILTCGIDKKVIKETKIRIHGLELKVKPEKKEIFPGEETKITVQLSEVDVKEVKKPVAGKRIQIKLKGIVNGHIHPSGYVTTNQNGKAVLTYEAGDKDKKVVVKAKFQPKDYPEFVEDESEINISQYSISARVMLKDEETNHHEQSGPSQESTKDKWNEYKEIMVFMHFKDRSDEDYSLISKDCIRYRYKLISYSAISCNYYGSHSYSKKSYWHQKKSDGHWNGSVEDIEPDSHELVLDIDPHSGKVLYASWPSFTVKLSISGHTKCTKMERIPGGDGWKKEDCSESIDDHTSFDIGYERLDSSESPCQQFKTGDGIHLIGGRCMETFKTPGGEENISYEWQIFRK